MLRRRLLLACLLNWFAIAGAQAQDTVLWSNVGQWQIRIDKSVAYGCFMLGSYTRGTVLRIGFDQQNRNGYILVGNEAWHSLQVGNRYDLTLRFDNAAPWRGRATARRLGTGSMIFLYLSFDNSRFLVELARRINLTIFYAGNVVTQLPLRGTYAATQELLRCQRVADEARNNAPPQDPFAGGGGPSSGGPLSGPGGPSPSGPSGPGPSGPSGPSAGPGGPAADPAGPASSPGGPVFSPTGPSPSPGGGPASGAPAGGPGGPSAPAEPAPSGPVFSPTKTR